MTMLVMPASITVEQNDGGESIAVTLLVGFRACPACRRATSLFVARDLVDRCSECDHTYKELRDAAERHILGHA